MRHGSLLISLLVACGPQKSSSDSTADTGSASESATGAATEPATTTDTPTEPATASTGEPVSCEMFATPPPDQFTPADISIGNQRTETVWIGAQGCGGLPNLRIVGAGGVNMFAHDPSCSPVFCEEFLGADSCLQGCDDCGSATALRFAPGARFALTWSGAHFVPMQMTAACAPGEDCERECLHPEPVPPDSYSVELTAFAACDGVCECDGGDSDLGCPIFDSLTLSEPFEIKATLNYPDATSVELVIE